MAESKKIELLTTAVKEMTAVVMIVVREMTAVVMIAVKTIEARTIADLILMTVDKEMTDARTIASRPTGSKTIGARTTAALMTESKTIEDKMIVSSRRKVVPMTILEELKDLRIRSITNSRCTPLRSKPEVIISQFMRAQDTEKFKPRETRRLRRRTRDQAKTKSNPKKRRTTVKSALIALNTSPRLALTKLLSRSKPAECL